MMINSFDPGADMYIADMKQREDDMLFFKISGLELYLSLLNISIALFSFILTRDNCLVHC